MYNPGTIIYFDPFYFPDGNSAKPKYCLILKVIEDSILIANLPTSKDHVPGFLEKKHGCIDHKESNFNCYYFSPNNSISDDGWAFPFETFLYGMYIDEYNLKTFREIYQFEGVDYDIACTLTDEEFVNVIDCFKKSSTVKRKFKRLI